MNAIDYAASIEQIMHAAHQSQRLGVTALAVHGVMTGVLDRIQRARLNALDLIVPDGQPVRWALNGLYGIALKDRVYGPTLMLKLCECAAQDGLPIFLYGSKPDVLLQLSQRLKARFPQLKIAGVQPSRFRCLTPAEKQQDIEAIINSGARLVFVGLGCPRQEVWVYEHLPYLQMPMIAVGAAFDFHAGHVPQAPAWMQRHGLEWLYRWWQEPRRLWRRYFLLNPAYVLLVFLQWSGIYILQPDASRLPENELRYG